MEVLVEVTKTYTVEVNDESLAISETMDQLAEDMVDVNDFLTGFKYEVVGAQDSPDQSSADGVVA